MARELGWAYRTSVVEFAVLGPLQVSGDRGPIEIAGGKERALLAHLIADAGRTVTTDDLIDSLWGDDPPRTAAKSLQTHVHRLRNALEPDRHGSPSLLVTEGPGYRLAVPDDAIDASLFARLVDLGRRAYLDGRVEAAALTLRQALALWRGPAYAGFEYTRFGAGESRRLEELRRDALEDRIAADLDLGRAREAVPELESLVHEDPLRERLWWLLVLALYRAGRQADALGAYARARRILTNELGVEPGEDLRSLHAQVLSQDEGLRAPATGRALPPALVPPPGPFVGRDRELALLRSAWDQAVTGQPAIVILRGPPGSGRRRLAAELAVAIADQAGLVEFHSAGIQPPGIARTATLTVLGSQVLQVAPTALAGSRLTVVVRDPSGQVPDGATVLDLQPLAAEHVRTILGNYLDDTQLEQALPGILRQSGGIPGRVHAAALEMIRRRAADKVSAAAARTDRMHAALGLARDDLRSNVAEFHDVLDRAQQAAADSCPWKGLAAYEVADAPLFAGRERLVADLVTRMASSRLLAIVGASGSGKSSLVRAGLLASLAAGALPGSDGWIQLVMRPGPHPLREMAQVALRGAEPTRDRVADLLERMVYDDQAAGRLVLVVDQLEETWTTCSDPAERESFLEALADVVQSESRCTVVLVVRAEYVAELADQPVLAAALSDATVLVGAPDAAEVRRCVQRPADRAGLELEIGLADALVADTGDEPGSLPLLSTALTELWDHREGRLLTLAGYVSAGGIQGAVARIAERAYGALEPADQAAARILLLRLAGPGEGEAVTRRRVPLARLSDLPDDRVRAVVDPLADARLLSVSADHVEVAHEALFREWPRLRAWLEEDAAGRAVQRRLTVAAEEWDAAGRDAAELWRGTRLAAGVEFAATHPDEVTEIEHTFLEASLAQQDAERRAAEERAAVATRKNRQLRWLLSVLGLLLVVALVTGVLAAQAGGRAERAALVATVRELAAAAVASIDHDPELSVLLALEAVDRARTAASPVQWEAEEALHYAVMASRVVLTVPDIGGAADWSPDGTVFVTEGPEDSGIVDVRDAESGESVHSWHGHDVDVNDVAFNHDGSMLATGGDDGSARVWDPVTGAQLASIQGPPDGEAWAPSFSLDGSLLAAVWPHEGLVRLLDLATGTVREIDGLDGSRATSFSPDGTRLAVSSGFDSVAIVLDVDSGEEALTLEGHQGGVDDVAWSPDGRWIATGSLDGSARIWDAETGRTMFTLFGHIGVIHFAAWSPDSSRLLTGSEDGTVKMWEITESWSRELLTLPGPYYSGAFSPDGDRVITSEEGIEAVTIWDVSLSGEAEWATLPADPHGFSGLDFTPDGRLVSYRGDGLLSFWDTESGRESHTIDRHGTHDFAVAVNPDGRLIATASIDEDEVERVMVLDAATGEHLFTVPDGQSDASWSADGDLLATGNHDGRITIVDRDGKEVTVLTEDPGWRIGEVRFSPAGRLLATTRYPTGRLDPLSPRVRIWDWEGRQIVQTIDVIADAVAFDPTGTRLVTASPHGSVDFWDVQTGQHLAALAGHTAPVWSIAFSSDGGRIATAGSDGTIRLWDAASAVPMLALRGHGNWVWSVAFSPDGSKLASSSADGTTRVWALDLDDLIGIAERKLSRTLTDVECRQYLHMEQCPHT